MSAETQYCFARTEKKYLLTGAQYRAFLRTAKPHLRPDAYSHYDICSLYCDTDDYALIRASLEKPVYKEKLRLRSYGVPKDGDRVFLELKKKFDGVVYKRRVDMTAAEAARYLAGEAPVRESQIQREIDWLCRSHPLKPKVLIAYSREAYSGTEDDQLRVTFDTDIRARSTRLDLRAGDQGSALLPEDRVLMEIKFPGTAPLWLARLLSEEQIFPASFSKYGTYYQQIILGQKADSKYMKEVLHCA